MKRKAVICASGFFFGAFVSFYLTPFETLVFMLAVLFCLALSAVLPKSKRSACMLVALCAVLASAYSFSAKVFKIAPLEELSGETVTVSGVVSEYTLADRSAVVIKGEANGIPCKILTYINGFGGDYGDKISFEGRVLAFEDSPLFNAKEHYLPDGIYAKAAVTDNLVITDSGKSFVSELRSYSLEVSNKIRSFVGGNSGDVLSAMICGNTSAISGSVKLSLNRAGIRHIISVSGLHVSVIAFAVIWGLRKLRLPKILVAVAAETVVVSFVVFSGCRISCIRAAIMISVYILSTVVNRRADALNTLSIAALLIMLSNPFAAADVSFILSVSGAFGVSVAAPYVTGLLGTKRALIKSFVICTCACVCTIPFVILHFNEVSLIAPFVNMALVPICSLALCLGMLFCACGCPQSLSFIIEIAGKLVDIVIFICEKLSSCKLSYLPTGYADVYAVAALLVITCCAALIIKQSRKLIVLSTVTVVCVFVCVTSFSMANQNVTKLEIFSSNSDCCVLLRKNDECIIIDINSGGTLANECENYIEKNGIVSVDAVIIADKAESAYSAYVNSLGVKPEVIYLPDESYIFNGNVDCLGMPAFVSAYGYDVRVKDDLITVSKNGESVAVSINDYYGVGTVANVCVMPDLCVVNAKDRTVYRGDTLVSVNLH